jgi:hypothetical protein
MARYCVATSKTLVLCASVSRLTYSYASAPSAAAAASATALSRQRRNARRKDGFVHGVRSSQDADDFQTLRERDVWVPQLI